MKKSPKKAPAHMISRSERKQFRRERRISKRKRDDSDRKRLNEGCKKPFPKEVIAWILNRCERVEILGDRWRVMYWIFKGKTVAEWSTRFATPKLTIRGFGAYKEKVDIRDERFDPDSFNKSFKSVDLRKRR